MAGFTAGLWRSEQYAPPFYPLARQGHLGKITSLKDLPKDSVLKNYIKDAMKLNDDEWHVLTVSRRDPKTGEYTMEKAPLYHLVGKDE